MILPKEESEILTHRIKALRLESLRRPTSKWVMELLSVLCVCVHVAGAPLVHLIL